MHNTINEIGNVYGKLIVIGRSILPKNATKKDAKWKCKCECGNVKHVIGYNLRNGHTKSCGCSAYEVANKNRKWKGCGELSLTFFNSFKYGALNRNLKFDVTIEYLWEIYLSQNRKCNLSGIELILPKHNKDNNKTASLDRIDSSKGYIIGNVQWIHKDINLMKMNLNQKTFINYCKLIYEKYIK
jgi:hypothetical protein